MCFGGGGKTPSLPPTPPPQPTPTPAAAPGEVAASAESKRAKTAALKFGAMNTIRNFGGAVGVSGSGADLSNPAALAGQQKKTIGA
jgi:hypothetical protein